MPSNRFSLVSLTPSGVPRRSALQRVAAVHSLRQARTVLGLSQSEIGKAMARLMGRAEPVRRSTVANWERGKVMAKEYRDAVGRLLATWLARALDRDDVGLTLHANSPWQIRAMARCRCGRWYRLRRAHWYGCPRHRRTP